MILSKYLLSFGLIFIVACSGESSESFEPPPQNNDGSGNNDEPLPNPDATGSIALASFAGALKLKDNYLYVTGITEGVSILDITDPANITQVGSSNNSSSRIAIEGNRAFVSVAQDIFIYDISNPRQMDFLNSLNISMDLRGLAIKNNILYVGASAAHPLSVYDVSDPMGTSFLDDYPNNASTPAIVIRSNNAFLADYTHFRILDVSDPTQMSLLSEIELFPTTVYFIKLSGNLALMSGGAFHIVDVTDDYNPNILSTTIPESASTNGIAWSPISLAYNENLVYLGFNDHIRVYDISDPTNPIEIGKIKTSNLIMDLAFHENQVYVLLENFPCNAGIGSDCPLNFVGVEAYNVSDF